MKVSTPGSYPASGSTWPTGCSRLTSVPSGAVIVSVVGSKSSRPASAIAITLTGSDADGSVGFFRIDTLPANGVLYADAGATLAVQAKDIVDTAVAAGNFKTLATALQAAGLIDTLKGKGPFTVFAPTDEAFAKVPKDQLDALLKDKAALTKVLTYHVVPGKVMAKDVKAGKVKTVQGSELTLATAGGVMVDGAKVTATDIVADNGVIHVIDSVVLPK